MIVDKIYASGKFGVWEQDNNGKFKVISDQFDSIEIASKWCSKNCNKCGCGNRKRYILPIPSTEKWGIWAPSSPGDADLISPKLNTSKEAIEYAKKHNIKILYVQKYDEEGNAIEE